MNCEPVNDLFNCDFLCSTQRHCVLENIVVVVVFIFYLACLILLFNLVLKDSASL